MSDDNPKDFEVPTCETCGAQQWTRESRMRLSAQLNATGSWEVYDDDYIESDRYYCYECNTVPGSDILNILIHQ